MIRIIKPELVVRTCFDPMRRSGAVAAVCKEHLLASVHRDKDPSDVPSAVSQEIIVLPASLVADTGFGLALKMGGRFSSRQNARSS